MSCAGCRALQYRQGAVRPPILSGVLLPAGERCAPTKPIVQISTDGFPAYPEAVDLAFGPYARYRTIIKEYRNASMIYTPSEMVGTRRTGIRGDKPPGRRNDNHEPRGTAEWHTAGVLEAAQPTDALLLQKAGEPGGSFRHVRLLLQLLLADPVAWEFRQETADRRHDGRVDRSHVELRGVVPDGAKFSNTLLGHYLVDQALDELADSVHNELYPRRHIHCFGS